MNHLFFKLYLYAPFFLKRVLANIEAIRRDKYRRRYKLDNHEQLVEIMKSYSKENDVKKIIALSTHAKQYVPYFKTTINNEVITEADFKQLPLLTKDIVKNKQFALVSELITSRSSLWKNSTSGSTGSPLVYYRDKKSVSSERSAYDEYYKYCGCNINENKARISGVKIAPFERKKPPFWVFVDRYKQLQCSAYHITQHTFQDYLKAFKKHNVSYGTGFPSGWSALAGYMIENKISYYGLKAIVTDSEDLSSKNRQTIEDAFNCQVYRTYGLAEVGMCAIECENKHYHILPSHFVEICNSKGEVLNDGEIGEIIVTDYNSFSFPYIRYATGDLGIMHHDKCGCGMLSPYLSDVTGRLEDYVLTKDGRKVTRLSQILKPAIGIKESQIIQHSRDEVLINILPNQSFKPESMKKVVEVAKSFLGEMQVKWQVVDKLERTAGGKLKFLIRNIPDQES